MCTVLLPLAGYPTAVNRYIIIIITVIIIVRYSNSLRPRSVKMAPCCFLLCYGLGLSAPSESTQNLPPSVPRCSQQTKDGRSSAACRSPFCPPALSTESGSFVFIPPYLLPLAQISCGPFRRRLLIF